MAKIAPSRKQKSAVKKPPITHAPISSNSNNSKLVSETLLECVRTGDLNSFRTVLATHIMSSNKVHLARRSGLGRQTLYDLVDPKRNFDPALSTLSAIIRGLAEC